MKFSVRFPSGATVTQLFPEAVGGGAAATLLVSPGEPLGGCPAPSSLWGGLQLEGASRVAGGVMF